VINNNEWRDFEIFHPSSLACELKNLFAKFLQKKFFGILQAAAISEHFRFDTKFIL